MLYTNGDSMLKASKTTAQKTVKAFSLDILLINEQARLHNCTAAEFIHQLCEDFRKTEYQRELEESFDNLLANPTALAEFKADQDLWDITSSDGLNDGTT
jgi:hypothetical protein